MTRQEQDELIGTHTITNDEIRRANLRDLCQQAQWAIQLLSKHAQPYNHEYTCVKRLTTALGAVERA